jgi:hypothetical protein
MNNSDHAERGYGRRALDHHPASPLTMAVGLIIGVQSIAVFTLIGMFQGLSVENTRIVKEHGDLKHGMYQVAEKCSEFAVRAKP